MNDIVDHVRKKAVREDQIADDREARLNADRVMAHRARKAVDQTPAELAARLRADKPVSPDVLAHSEAVSALSVEYTTLQAEASATAKLIREYQNAGDKSLPSPPSLKVLEKAEADVEALDARRRIARAERDRVVAEFELDHARPYAKQALISVTMALHGTVTELGEHIAGMQLARLAGTDKLMGLYRTMAEDLRFPIQPEAPAVDFDIERAHGLAVVTKSALQDVMLLARESGGIMWSQQAPALKAARAMVEEFAALRRRRGDK